MSSVTFSKVDHEIHKILWRWAKRRHQNKSLKWVKEKYFKSHQGRKWVFSNDSKETLRPLHLFYASQIKIRRHIKIKQDANPFNPEWEIYFERREKTKLCEKRSGKKQAQHIFTRQNNLCAICRSDISTGTSWEYHFKQHWMHGGSAQTYNLAVMHPECHESLYARKDNKLGPLNRAHRGA